MPTQVCKCIHKFSFKVVSKMTRTTTTQARIEVTSFSGNAIGTKLSNYQPCQVFLKNPPTRTIFLTEKLAQDCWTTFGCVHLCEIQI